MTTIRAQMTGATLDRILLNFLNAEKTENNGKVCYISRGTNAFESWANLSDIIQMQRN